MSIGDGPRILCKFVQRAQLNADQLHQIWSKKQ